MALAHEDAAAAGRQLARARWGDTGLRRAVQVISDRRDELDGPLRDELREIAGNPARDGDDAR